MQSSSREMDRPRRMLALVGTLTMALLLMSCGGSDSDSASSTTGASSSVPPTTQASTTTTASGVTKPTCDEVNVVLDQLSASDRATLLQWQVLFLSRASGRPDGWLFLAMPTANSPSIAAYYEWSASSGLGPPLPVNDPGVRSDIQDASAMLINLMCATAQLGGADGLD